MALVACAECKREISDKAKACPGCGVKVPKRRTALWIVLSIPLIFCTYAILHTPSAEEAEMSQSRNAIALCWTEQERKSHASGEAAFIAGACEKMERDFSRKYDRKP